MTTVLKALDWLNSQLSHAMQLDFHEALCMKYHVCTACINGWVWNTVAWDMLYVACPESCEKLCLQHRYVECLLPSDNRNSNFNIVYSQVCMYLLWL